MPTYDYTCIRCGPFDALRPIAQREAAAPCPSCGEPASRVLGGMPRLGGALQGGRAGEGSYPRMRHPPACACCPR